MSFGEWIKKVNRFMKEHEILQGNNIITERTGNGVRISARVPQTNFTTTTNSLIVQVKNIQIAIDGKPIYTVDVFEDGTNKPFTEAGKTAISINGGNLLIDNYYTASKEYDEQAQDDKYTIINTSGDAVILKTKNDVSSEPLFTDVYIGGITGTPAITDFLTNKLNAKIVLEKDTFYSGFLFPDSAYIVNTYVVNDSHVLVKITGNDLCDIYGLGELSPPTETNIHTIVTPYMLQQGSMSLPIDDTFYMGIRKIMYGSPIIYIEVQRWI